MLSIIIFIILDKIAEKIYSRHGLKGWKLYVASFTTTIIVMMLMVLIPMTINSK